MDDDAGVFRALADPTRRQILQDLQAGELGAGEIASRFTISAPSISRHLGVLKSAGLIVERREANRIIYSPWKTDWPFVSASSSRRSAPNRLSSVSDGNATPR